MQTYYVDKLAKLNEDIRVIVDRQNRLLERRQKGEQDQNPKKASEMAVYLTPAEKHRIKEEVKIKVYELKKDNKTTEKKA